MAASKQAYKKRAERLSFCITNRKRYEVTYDSLGECLTRVFRRWFQYRKRYEVTCDMKRDARLNYMIRFQYRKRYEATYDFIACDRLDYNSDVSIPQAV